MWKWDTSYFANATEIRISALEASQGSQEAEADSRSSLEKLAMFNAVHLPGSGIRTQAWSELKEFGVGLDRSLRDWRSAVQ
jgi:hypothetical protein